MDPFWSHVQPPKTKIREFYSHKNQGGGAPSYRTLKITPAPPPLGRISDLFFSTSRGALESFRRDQSTNASLGICSHSPHGQEKQLLRTLIFTAVLGVLMLSRKNGLVWRQHTHSPQMKTTAAVAGNLYFFLLLRTSSIHRNSGMDAALYIYIYRV